MIDKSTQEKIEFSGIVRSVQPRMEGEMLYLRNKKQRKKRFPQTIFELFKIGIR